MIRVLLLCCLLAVGCEPPSEAEERVNWGRFEITRKSDFAYVRDKDTGAEYLSRYHGGIVKLDSQPAVNQKSKRGAE